MTAGACDDAPRFATIFAQLPADQVLGHGVMEKGDDSDKIRNKRQEEDIEPVIPPRSHRKEQHEYDKDV